MSPKKRGSLSPELEKVDSKWMRMEQGRLIYINTIVFNVFGIACIFFDMITSITAHKSK